MTLASICAFMSSTGLDAGGTAHPNPLHLSPIQLWNHSIVAGNGGGQASELEKVSQLNRITYLYIAPVIIFIGLVGDVLTVATLTHPLLRRSGIIYTYLTLLATTDLFTQLSVIPMILWLLDIRLCSRHAAFYYAHIGFPLANALMGASVWLVVFLTLSQYMAVCHPFRQSYLCKRRTAMWLSVVAYLLSAGLHVPWARKKYVVRVPSFGESTGLLLPSLPSLYGQSSQQLQCAYVICDRPRLEEWFHAYEWAREFFTRILPFILIAYFNAMILITYWRTKRERQRHLATGYQSVMAQQRQQQQQQQKAKNIKGRISSSSGVQSRAEREEKRLFTLLFAIIILFFLCTIPAAPLTILVAEQHSQNLSFQIFRAITNLLEFTKFALNFYLYCLINPDIRRICLHIIRCDELEKTPRVKGQPVNPLSAYCNMSATRSTYSTSYHHSHHRHTVHKQHGHAPLGPYGEPTAQQHTSSGASRCYSTRYRSSTLRRVSMISGASALGTGSGMRTRVESNASSVVNASLAVNNLGNSVVRQHLNTGNSEGISPSTPATVGAPETTLPQNSFIPAWTRSNESLVTEVNGDDKQEQHQLLVPNRSLPTIPSSPMALEDDDREREESDQFIFIVEKSPSTRAAEIFGSPLTSVIKAEETAVEAIAMDDGNRQERKAEPEPAATAIIHGEGQRGMPAIHAELTGLPVACLPRVGSVGRKSSHETQLAEGMLPPLHCLLIPTISITLSTDEEEVDEGNK